MLEAKNGKFLLAQGLPSFSTEHLAFQKTP